MDIKLIADLGSHHFAQLAAAGESIDLTYLANILKVILKVIGGFLVWQGAYQLLASKTEHKPDQGTDAWWTIGLGAFCFITGTGDFIVNAFKMLSF